MIGVSMALTIAVCVAGFSFLYASLDDVVGDFVSREQGADAEAPAAGTQVSAQDAPPTQVPAENAQPTAVPEPTSAPTEPPATPPDSEFAPDFQTSSENTLNLRSGPSSDGGDDTVVAVMPPASPLEYQNEDAPTDNPAEDGDRWMRFTTEDGDEGWIREIDVEPYEP